MMFIPKILIVFYLIVINMIGLMIMSYDKQRAIKKGWRIPERTLLLIALSGGSLGSLLGMYLFRHKTKHIKFVFTVPLLLLLQLWLLYRIFYTFS